MSADDCIYLLLGSNLGSRADNLCEATKLLDSSESFQLIRASSIYSSAAQEMESGAPDFLNQALECRYSGSAQELLEETKRIEQSMGRTKKNDYSSRVIDIDILLFGKEIVSNKTLTIPHPRLAHRAFALIPLLELNCSMRDPLTNEPYQECLTRLDSKLLPERYEYTA